MIAVSMLPFLVNVVATFINGEKVGDDPWEANTLEWATSSPPPPYNFDSPAADPQRAAGLRPAPPARRRSPRTTVDGDGPGRRSGMSAEAR